MEQRLLITYSPKYAAYQKEIRDKQIERAKAMLANGKHKKNRKNPNDPARFIDKAAVTKDGEIANILYFWMRKRSRRNHSMMVSMPYVQTFLMMNQNPS